MSPEERQRLALELRALAMEVEGERVEVVQFSADLRAAATRAGESSASTFALSVVIRTSHPVVTVRPAPVPMRDVAWEIATLGTYRGRGF